MTYSSPSKSKNRFLRQAALVILPKLLAGVGTACIGLVLMRFMAPAEFGLLSLCLSALLMMDGLLGSAFDLATVRIATNSGEGDCTTSYQAQESCIALKIGAVSIAAVLLISFHRLLLLAFFKGYGNVPLMLTLLSGCAVLLLRSAQIHFQLEKRFSAYGLIDLGHSGLKILGVGYLIATAKLTPTYVMVVYFVAPLTLVLLWAIRNGREILSNAVFSFAMTRQMFGQARWYLLTFGIGTLVARGDLWLVAHYTNMHTAGMYSAAQLLALIPPMIGTYLSVVVSPRIMPLFNSGKLLAFTGRVQSSLLLLSLVGYVMALMLLPRFSGLLPPKFHEALPVLFILLPGSLAGFVCFPLTLTTLMFLRPRFLVFLDAATVPIILVAYSLLVPRFGVIGAAWISSSVAMGRALIVQLVVLLLIRHAPQPQSSVEELQLTTI
jgi:O-antigen/teichoic acid export membrane protein